MLWKERALCFATWLQADRRTTQVGKESNLHVAYLYLKSAARKRGLTRRGWAWGSRPGYVTGRQARTNCYPSSMYPQVFTSYFGTGETRERWDCPSSRSSSSTPELRRKACAHSHPVRDRPYSPKTNRSSAVFAGGWFGVVRVRGRVDCVALKQGPGVPVPQIG